MNLIVVFNTCGIGGKENARSYVGHIHALLNQRGVNKRIVLSSCCNHPEDWDFLRAEFQDRISYYLTGDVIPVNMSFNHACQLTADYWWAEDDLMDRKFIDGMGQRKGFVYVDSGVHVAHDHKALAKLAETHESGDYGMTAALTDEDDGFNLWFPDRDPKTLFTNGRLVMPVGMTMNLHLQIFDRRVVELFGRPLPDVFASQCTESVFSFMCAAAGLKFVVHGERVRHYTGLDGPSAGFPLPGPGWKHLLPAAKRTMEEIIADPEALASGFGYEECQKILMHDPACYDADGNVKQPERLAKFIRENLFLPQTEYDKINHVFIP